MARLIYTKETIERAFCVHLDAHLIKRVLPRPEGGYLVDVTSGQRIELRNLREAHVFVYALASAKQALDRARIVLAAS